MTDVGRPLPTPPAQDDPLPTVGPRRSERQVADWNGLTSWPRMIGMLELRSWRLLAIEETSRPRRWWPDGP
jgi:hypothetical protein